MRRIEANRPSCSRGPRLIDRTWHNRSGSGVGVRPSRAREPRSPPTRSTRHDRGTIDYVAASICVIRTRISSWRDLNRVEELFTTRSQRSHSQCRFGLFVLSVSVVNDHVPRICSSPTRSPPIFSAAPDCGRDDKYVVGQKQGKRAVALRRATLSPARSWRLSCTEESLPRNPDDRSHASADGDSPSPCADWRNPRSSRSG